MEQEKQPLFDENEKQIVELSSGYYCGSYEQVAVGQTVAALSKNGATIFRTDAYKKPKHFALTLEECHAFANAWTAYQTQQQAAKEEKERAIAKITERANALVADYPGIDIKEERDEDGDPCWDVLIPKLGWSSPSYAYKEEELQKQLQHAFVKWHETHTR